MASQQNEYEELFLARLISEFPQWTKAKKEKAVDSTVLEIPSLNEGGHPSLWIIIKGFSRRITIGFGGGHVDLEDWHADRGQDAIFSSAIQLIQEIIDEEMVGVALNAGGGALARIDQLDSAPWAKQIIEIVSWKGTFNQNRR